MNEIQPSEQQSNQAMVKEREISLIDWLILLVQHKKLMLGLPAIFAVCAILLTLTMPNIYKATTKILPPQSTQSSAAALLAQLGGVAGSVAASGIKNPGDLYVGMLKSRTIADSLVQRFNLAAIYRTGMLEKTRNVLSGNTKIAVGKDGLITIEFEDLDPKRAAQIANAYVDELLTMMKTLAVTEASQRRLFFERELKSTKDKLTQAESLLKGSLENRGVVSVDSQSYAIIETVARLRAQITAKEIQISAMKAFVTENNQEYKRNYQELLGMRAELGKLENGGPETAAQKNQPEKQRGLGNIQTLRDLKSYQVLYELLSKQYEIARLDESREASVIQVVDKAIEPEIKSKPRRALIVEASTLLGFFLAIILVVVGESMKEARQNPIHAQRMERLKRSLQFR